MKTDYTLESLRPLSMSAIATPNPAAVDQSVTFTPAPPPVDTTDLYGYWPLDEASGTRFKILGSAVSADLLDSGGTPLPSGAGRFGLALVSTDQVGTKELTSTVNPAMDFSAGGTIALWFNSTVAYQAGFSAFVTVASAPATSIITINKYFDGPNEFLSAWASAGGEASGLLAPASSNGIPYPSINEWHLLVLTADPTAGRVTLYLDDRSQYAYSAFTGAFFAALNNLTKLSVNQRPSVGWQLQEGKLDDLRIWTRALTATEIEDLWTEAAPCGDIPPYTYLWDFGPGLPAVNQTGLYGYWPLDEASGTRAKTLGSATSADLAPLTVGVPSTAGRYGLAAQCVPAGFGNSPVLRNAALNPTLATDAGLTIAIWFKNQTLHYGAITESLFGLGRTVGNGSIGFFRSADTAWVPSAFLGDVHFMWIIDNAGTYNFTSQVGLGPFTRDVWHLAVIRVNSDGTFDVRIDGSTKEGDINTASYASPIGYATGSFTSTNYPRSMGALQLFNVWAPTVPVTWDYWHGEADDLRIWTRALTDAQIADLWYRSDEETPAYSYGEAGTQTISATVTSAHGCVASRSIGVVVS